MEATEQYFPVVLFIMLYKVVLTFESVDEILKRDHSNGSYWAVLFCGVVYYAVQGGSNFWVCGWNHEVWPFKWKLLSATFFWYSLICRCNVVLTFKSMSVQNKKLRFELRLLILFYFQFWTWTLEVKRQSANLFTCWTDCSSDKSHKKHNCFLHCGCKISGIEWKI